MHIKLNSNLDEANRKVTQAFKIQSFGVLTKIDVQKTISQNLDLDFKPYQILALYNPHFAYKALFVNEEIGLLIPRHVVLR